MLWLIQLGVRLAMAFHASGVNTVSGDQRGYWLLGHHFIEYLVNGNCERLPLYPGFVYVITAVCGLFSDAESVNLLVLFIAQHLLMMGGVHLLSRSAAILSGQHRMGYGVSLAVLSCYYPLLLYPNGVLTETLFIFLSVSGFFVLVRILHDLASFSPKALCRGFALSGGLMGGAALVRPTILLFPFFAVAVLVVSKRSLVKPALQFLVVFCLVLAPWFVRNTVIYGAVAYTSVAGANLHKVNKFEKPLTYSGRMIEKRRSRPGVEHLKKANFKRMSNDLPSFFNRKDVERDNALMAQALKNIRWHADYEFAAFFKEKLWRLTGALFQSASTEYIVANLNFPGIPLVVYHGFHVLLIVLAFVQLLSERRNSALSERLFMAYIFYGLVTSVLTPVCPRMLLPTVVILICFALKWVVKRPFVQRLSALFNGALTGTEAD